MLQNQKPNFIFTADGLLQAIGWYGDELFSLDANGLFVLEDALLHHPGVSKFPLCGNDFRSETLKILYNHWDELKFLPPWGFSHPEREECTIIAKMNDVYPDNIIICVGSIKELAHLCKVYSKDDIIIADQIADYLK